MELTEINELADDLLAKLRDSTSAADVRDLVFRLDGLYRGAQIKTLLPKVTAQGPCGFEWKWNQGREQHYEMCTLPAGHDGTHHLNEVTGINKRKLPDCNCSWATRQAMSESNTLVGSHHDDTCPLFRTALTIHGVRLTAGHAGLHNDGGKTSGDEPTKPVADRLHELVSYLREALSFQADRSAQSTDAPSQNWHDGQSKAYTDAAEKLEALLMEGGI